MFVFTKKKLVIPWINESSKSGTLSGLCNVDYAMQNSLRNFDSVHFGL